MACSIAAAAATPPWENWPNCSGGSAVSRRSAGPLQKLFSPNLEKALVFLDDKQLPSTSNAVERGNRRFRKMQKTVYCVRTRLSIQRRIALDLLREMQANGRFHATTTLHRARRFHRPTLPHYRVNSVTVL